MFKYSRLLQSSECEEKYHDPVNAADDDSFPEFPRAQRGPKHGISWFRRYWCSVAVHIALLLLNGLLVTLYASMFLMPKTHLGSSNTLQDNIKLEKHRFELLAIYRHDGDLNPHKTNNFSGPPRPELEEAWDRLMKNADIKVSHAELGEFAGDDSVIKLSDGSGYYVTVSAFHGLHCVKRLHMYIYAEHYYAGLSEFELFMLRRHTEHCLDWLRQHIQCHADPTFIPIHWTTNDANPVASDDGNHQCADWSQVEEWMAERSFDPFEPGLLVHPIFGDPYTENQTHPDLGVTEIGTGKLLNNDGKVSA